jgi:hypothetical protein
MIELEDVEEKKGEVELGAVEDMTDVCRDGGYITPTPTELTVAAPLDKNVPPTPVPDGGGQMVLLIPPR